MVLHTFVALEHLKESFGHNCFKTKSILANVYKLFSAFGYAVFGVFLFYNLINAIAYIGDNDTRSKAQRTAAYRSYTFVHAGAVNFFVFNDLLNRSAGRH
jgi:hypothetical protein